jgi:parvulin-like peptidyl-prolyl isomerase
MVGCAASDGSLLGGLKDRLRGKRQNSDNTIVTSKPAAPTNAEKPASTAASSHEPVIAASATDQAQSREPIGEVTQSIIARVNGDVILAQDVLNLIRGQLAKAQQEMPAAQFPQYRMMLIQKQLRDLIERQLLIQEAKRNIPDAFVKRLEGAADKEFGKRIESEMRRMEVNTESELRRKMLENGESLDQIRDFHRGTFIAQNYLQMQLQPRLEVSREEMVEYYNQHRGDYKIQGGVVWSEILVTFEKCGSREAAKQKASEIVQQLRSGADFAELARTESEGATAPNGGRWDLTAKGSYIVKSVDDALFNLAPGKVSDPIEGQKGWHIVRVEEKKEGGETGFVDAQDEIRRLIKEQKIAKESQQYMQQLMRKAHILTVFDRPNQGKSPEPRSN